MKVIFLYNSLKYYDAGCIDQEVSWELKSPYLYGKEEVYLQQKPPGRGWVGGWVFMQWSTHLHLVNKP